MGRVRDLGCIFYFCKHGIPLTCQCTWIWFQVASSLKLARTAAASAALFMGALSESLLQSNCHWDYGGSMRDCYFCAVECAKRLLLVTVGLCLRIHAGLWQLSCRGKAKSLAIHTKNTTFALIARADCVLLCTLSLTRCRDWLWSGYLWFCF